MKHKNSILMVLAMLLMIPFRALAVDTGCLFVNDNKNYSTKSYVSVTYNGKSYKAYPMSGAPNVYYVPPTTTNPRILYMKNANFKFIQTTKSLTNEFVIVVEGTNTMTYGGGSNFKLEKSSVKFTGNGTLNVNQTGTHYGMFATLGSITIEGITLNVTTKGGHDAIRQEAANGKLTIKNAKVTTNGPVLAKGGLTLTGSKFADSSLAWNKSTGYICKNGTKATAVSIVINTPVTTPAPAQKTTAQKVADLIDESKGTATLTLPYGWKVLGRNTFKCTMENVTIDGKNYSAYKLPFKNDEYHVCYVSQLQGLVFMGTKSVNDGNYISAIDNLPFVDMPRTTTSASLVKLTAYINAPKYSWRFCSSEKASFFNCSYGTLHLRAMDSNPMTKRIDAGSTNEQKGKRPMIYFGGTSLQITNLNLQGGSIEGTGSKSLYLTTTSITGTPIKGFSFVSTDRCGLDNTNNRYNNLSLNLTTGVFNTSDNLIFTTTGNYVPIETKANGGSTNTWWFKYDMATNSSQSVTLPFYVNNQTQFMMKEKKTIDKLDCAPLAGKTAYKLYYADGTALTISGAIYWLPSEKAFYLENVTGINKIKSDDLFRSTTTQELKIYTNGDSKNKLLGSTSPGLIVRSSGGGKIYVYGGFTSVSGIAASGDVTLDKAKMSTVSCTKQKTLTMTSSTCVKVSGFLNIITTNCGLSLSYKGNTTLVYNKTKGQWFDGNKQVSVKIDAIGGGSVNTPGCVEIDTRYNVKTVNGDQVWPVTGTRKVWPAGPMIAS